MKIRSALTRSYGFNKIELEATEVEIKDPTKMAKGLGNITDILAKVIDSKTGILEKWTQEASQATKKANQSKFNPTKPLIGKASDAQIKALEKAKVKLSRKDYQLFEDATKGRQHAYQLIQKSMAAAQSKTNQKIVNE